MASRKRARPSHRCALRRRLILRDMTVLVIQCALKLTLGALARATRARRPGLQEAAEARAAAELRRVEDLRVAVAVQKVVASMVSTVEKAAQHKGKRKRKRPPGGSSSLAASGTGGAQPESRAAAEGAAEDAAVRAGRDLRTAARQADDKTRVAGHSSLVIVQSSPVLSKSKSASSSPPSSPSSELSEDEAIYRASMPGETTWQDLSAAKKLAAEALGWGAQSWAAGSIPVLVHETAWSMLSASQRAAAQALSHTAASWDGTDECLARASDGDNDIRTFPFNTLALRMRSAVRTFCVEPDEWDRPNCWFSAGDAPDVPWERLPAEMQRSAGILKYDAVTWCQLRDLAAGREPLLRAGVPWRRLTFCQQASAGALGWTEDSWGQRVRMPLCNQPAHAHVGFGKPDWHCDLSHKQRVHAQELNFDSDAWREECCAEFLLRLLARGTAWEDAAAAARGCSWLPAVLWSSLEPFSGVKCDLGWWAECLRAGKLERERRVDALLYAPR